MLLRQFHQRATGIDQRNSRADAGKGDRRALVDFDSQAIGNEAHHAGRFHPGNLLELRFLLGERDEENVAADIGAHHFHDLRLGHVLHAGDVDVVARLDAETPGAFAVFVHSTGGECGGTEQHSCDTGPQEAVGSFLRK